MTITRYRDESGGHYLTAHPDGDLLKHADAAPLIADGERLRYLIAIMHAAEGGDPTAAQVMNDTPPPEMPEDSPLPAIMQAFRDNIDAMRAKWQPLEWD